MENNHIEHNHSEQGHSHHHHQKIDNKFKLLVVIIFNVIITAAEYIGGIMSGSLALISDAGHNLSDVLSLILGYAGEKVSEKGPNKKFTFGLKRFEVLIALINAITLLGIGGYIFFEVAERFNNPQPIDITVMLPVAIVGLLGNFFSIVILVKEKDRNINMKAAFLHLLYDTISSLGVIIAAVIIHFTNLYWIDLLFSIIIVLMIVWSSKDIIIEALRIFLQGTPKHIDLDKIYESIMNVNNVADVHGLHIWSINSTEVFLSCHICIENNKNIDNNKIIQSVNKMLEDDYKIDHTTLQVEDIGTCTQAGALCCR